MNGSAVEEPRQESLKVLPLSPLQHGILAAALRNPGPGHYVTQAVFSLSGDIDAERWRECWQLLNDRHEALRTGFVWDRQGEPVQVVAQPSRIDLRQVEAKLQSEVEQWLERDRLAGFDLQDPPLFRLALLREDGGLLSHVFTFHHLLLDGWSVELLIRQALGVYNSAGSVDTAVLDESPSFSRYLAWYRKQRQAAAGFWSRYLEKIENPAPLPGDTGDDGDGFQDSERRWCLDSKASAGLRDVASALGVTVNTVVLALWAALLGRASGRRQILVGTVHSGRDIPVPGIARTVGLIMNALPLRVSLDPSATFRSVAEAVMSDTATVGGYGHITPAEIVSCAAADSGGRLFETMVVFESVPEAGEQGPGLNVASRRYTDRTDIPLSVLVLPGDTFEFVFVFNGRRVTKDTVESLATALFKGLSELHGNYDTTLAELSFGSGAKERPTTGKPERRTVELIRRSCQQVPDSVAVSQGGHKLSYAELGERARSLAAFVRSEDRSAKPVLVDLPVSPESISVLVGLLFAGRPYVYLDPDYPLQYREQIGSTIVRRFGEGVLRISMDGGSGIEGTRTVTLEECLRSVASDDPVPDPGDSDLVYIVFTSGSTGRPKGIAITHGNLDYSNDCRIRYYQSPVERFLLLSPLSFDSSVVGLIWTLTTGGELVLTTAPVRAQLDRLAHLIEAPRITHTLCLPSVHRMILNQSRGDQLKTLTTVIVAGEPCSRENVDLHVKALPHCRLYNEYGPSEATVWCSVARLDENPGAMVSVGRAIDGTVLSIVNPEGEVIPDGLEGEIAVSGSGVAGGYIDEPHAGDGRFVADLETPAYFTGDLAVRVDGEFYLRGRRDHQVKIRGVRVELGYVEDCIDKHEGVIRSAVIAAENDGHKRLCAFVQGRDGLTPGDLRDWLRDRLPESMVPMEIQVLESLPTLPNGKLNRNALRSERTQRPASSLGDVNLSANIRVLMGQVTGTEPESDDTSFFDAGGDSLSAVRLVELVRQEVETDLNVADVYEYPTPRGMADLINTTGQRDDWLSVTPIQGGRLRPLFFAYGNARQLAQVLPENQALYWVVHGRHGVVFPIDDIHRLAARHLPKIRAIQAEGPYRLGGFSLGALVSIEIARMLRAAGEDVELLFLVDPTSPQRFLVRSRYRRLRAFLKAHVPVREKVRYLVELFRRSPGILRVRLSKTEPAPPAPVQDQGGMTLHETNVLSRDQIVAEVEAVLGRHRFQVCPGHAVVARPAAPKGQVSLEWLDEAGYWDSLFAGPVEHLSYDTSGRHVDLFSDRESLAAVGRWVTQRLE